MMDVSDGLLLDARRMAEASGVRIDLDPALDEALDEIALRGGEDHALLACFAPGAALPDGFRPIGRVHAREAHGETDASGAVTVAGAPATGPGGWDPHRDWDAARG